MNVFFQFGEFYGGQNSFLKDSFSALIGTLTALFFFYLKIWHERKKDNDRNKQINLAKLQYLIYLIEGIIKSVAQQNDYIRETISSIEKNSVESQSLNWVPKNDLKRLAIQLNQEDYFLAYIKELGKDEDSIRRFKEIFSILYFLDTVFDQVFKLSKEVGDSFISKRNQYVSSYYDLEFEIVRKASSNMYDKVLNHFLIEKMKEIRSQKEKKNDFAFIHNGFVLSVSDELLEKYSQLDYSRELYSYLIPLINQFEEIKKINIDYLDYLQKAYTDIQSEILQLENKLQKIKTKFHKI